MGFDSWDEGFPETASVSRFEFYVLKFGFYNSFDLLGSKSIICSY